MDPKAAAILQAISQASQKPMVKADQINQQACPTCGQPVPQDGQAQSPQDSDSFSDQ
jgi:hypothetical protein